MSAPLVITQYWARDAANPNMAIEELKLRLNALDELPSHVTLVSAGEVFVLLDPLAIEFHQWLSEHCQVTFISAACTSLHAGILDFYHSDFAATVVISLELNKSFQQSCLNSLGIGNDNAQDSLDVVPGVGFIALKRSMVGKQLEPHELVVEKCQLLSQQPGMTGTQILIRQLYQELEYLPEYVLPVSFDICANWAKSLLRGLDNQLAVNQKTVNWLASIESCQRHYLSLKPLFELQLYRQKLKQSSLLLFTLGGGGRVGMLQLGKNSEAPIKLPEASFDHQSLVNDIDGYELALSLLQGDKSAYYQQIRTTLKYPHSRYRGKENHYFKWQTHPSIEQTIIKQAIIKKITGSSMRNSQSIMPKYDVAIIGAGWSGLALARQLKRNNRDIRIIQLEVSTEFKAKIGEATVENTGHYFLKKLGLANYLYRNQLPKNALRFFFDNEDHSLPIEQMSEQGTTYIPPHPAFQLDRASFESALTDMNREDDITVLQGAKVTGFELDHHNEHTVKFNYQNEAHQIRCKWLVDASGRAGVVARRMKSYSRENVPSHSSAWGRFSGVKDFDSVGTQKWRDGASSRFLSTNHFSGHGYWIWFIPLKNGLTSIGIVCDKTKVKNPPMKQADFIAKLKEHTAIADLIEDAKIEDFEAWGLLAYRGKGIVNRERWGATGFAAMFLDPLLSGGGDVIAMANDNLTKLILADLGNPDREAAQMALDEAVPYANEVVDYYYQFLYAQLMNLYPVLECAELCSPVMAYINATYFITSAWDYMAGNFSDYDHFSKNDFIRRGNYGLEMLMQRQILEALAILQNENRAFVRNNEGFFETGADLYKYYIYQMGEKGKDGYRIDLRVKLFTECFAIVTGSKLGLPKFGRRRIVQNTLNLPMILQKPTFGRDQLPELLITMSHNLTQELQQTTEHTVSVKITEASFRDEMVEVTIVDNTADADQLKKIKKTANGIWMHQQEYIDQTSFVSVFLQYARQQPLDIMDPSHPVRLEASEMCEA